MFGDGSMVTLLLGGIVSGAMFGALLSMVKYVADPQDQLPSTTYWLMGSLANARLSDLAWLSVPTAGLMALLWALGRVLDIMSRTLGVPVTVVRYREIIAATLASACRSSCWYCVGPAVDGSERGSTGRGDGEILPVSALTRPGLAMRQPRREIRHRAA
ncbi:MAG TPA: iron chelate uptake ABC transporter family permease subunit [Paenirhodobacter sp.]